MSSLSQAGRSIMTNEINRAFTKGLYGVDPTQLERKQQQRRAYQQELKKQAEEAQQRKARQKQKLKEQDEKLQRKIEMDIQREKQERQKASKQSKQVQQSISNNSNNTQINSPNLGSNSNKNNQFVSQRKGNFNSQSSENIASKSSINNQQINIYRNVQSSMGNLFIDQSSQPEPVYSSETRNIYNYEEQRYFQEEIQNRARRFKQTLDRKLDEVYLQIESSKKVHAGESVVDQIRRKLKSNSYLLQSQDLDELQKSGFNHFQEEFSQFYRIPKKQNNLGFESNSRSVRNLDYESESKFSSRLGNYKQSSNYNSRISTQRNQRGGSEARWRLSGRKNDIGKREALDLKLDATLANIGDIINSQNKIYGQ